MNMTLEQAIETLTIAESQQMSGRVEEAIRIVLAELKQVGCEQCKHYRNVTRRCCSPFTMSDYGIFISKPHKRCKYGERR